jgi:uncharacterized protein YaaW (UPF0174 family)
MAKKFFDHLVEIDTIHLEIEELNLEEKQKEEIKKLIEDNLYHTILDAILSELTEEDKKIFLSHIVEDDHDKIWKLLNTKIENIDEKIKQAADAVKKELRKDIESTKSL